jgi:hypothetical protein
MAQSPRERGATIAGCLSIRRQLLICLFLLTACVPSQTPPPAPPPGMPFVIADGHFTSGDLRLRIPEGWRVVTGEAGAPLMITLVAPDECSVIVVSAAPLAEAVRAPACDLPLREVLRSIEGDTGRYSISASAPEAEWAAFEREVEGVMDSIESTLPQD